MTTHSHVTKVSFTVSVRSILRPGEQVGVAVSADGIFDASCIIPMVIRLEEQAANPSSPAVSGTSTIWETVKPLSIVRGSPYKYRYAILNSSGGFSSWEKLPGTVESREVHTTGKLMALDDVFGELDDDVVQRQLDENAENTKLGDIMRAAQVVSKLKDSFGPEKKLMIVSYNLPIVLRKHPVTHEWSATWIEDDVLARTTNSIADDIATVWIGCITRECIDLSTCEESKRTRRAHSQCKEEDVLGEVPSETAATASATLQTRKVLTKLTAGGIDIDAFVAEAAAGGPGGASVTVRAPAACDTANEVTFPSNTTASLSSNNTTTTTPNTTTKVEDGDDTMAVTFSQADMIAITRVLNGMGAVPIFLPSDTHEAFACYTMSVLKPCMHNVLETGAQNIFPYAASLEYLSEGWKSFATANEMIANVIVSQYNGGDVVWVNDYPLWLVPKYVIDACATASLPRPPLLFFWHSPFPTSEIFRTLSVRDQLLDAIVQCDVIGFHTFNYARHFLQSVKRMLGINYQSQRGGNIVLDVAGRDVIVSIAHVGVEAEALDRWMASDQAASVAKSFAEKYRGKIVIAGIDTCQRLSGVALKLLAFERLLEENPRYRKHVVLVQRCEMRQALTADIKRTSSELRERVERIRQMYGDVLDYEEAASYSPTYRVGLFHQADIFLQTPIREGTNMLPLEYVYVRTRWQIQRSKALAGLMDREGMTSPGGLQLPPLQTAQPSPAAGSDDKSDSPGTGRDSTPLIMEMKTPAPRASVDDHTGLISDAALKAVTTGMPDYYATLAAPPSALSKKGRAQLANAFRPAARPERSDTALSINTPMEPVPEMKSAESSPTVHGRSRSSSSALPSGAAVTPTPAASELVVPVDDTPLVAPLPPPPRGGCVMLSEFSTAAQILNSNLVVNPWSISLVCREMDKAITMPDHERSFRQWRDYKYAIRNPAGSWSRQVVADVIDAHANQIAARVEAEDLVKLHAAPSHEATVDVTAASPMATAGEGMNRTLLERFRSAKRKLLILDYGGTIMDRAPAGSSKIDFVDAYTKHIPTPVVNALATLSQDPGTTIYIVSGLRSAAIDALHLSHLHSVGLAAENGMFVSHPGTETATDTAVARAAGSKQPELPLGGALSFEISEVLGSPPPLGNHSGSSSSISTAGPATQSNIWPTMGATPQMHHMKLPLSTRSAKSSARHAASFLPARRWVALTPSSSDKLSEWASVKSRAVALMNEYQWRVNGSVTRVYESLVAWDFRNADAEWAQSQAQHLAEDLETLSSETVKVSIRKSRVEVSLRAMNKGKFVTEILKDMPEQPDFMLIAGDDVTDEEMFLAAFGFYHPDAALAEVEKLHVESRSPAHSQVASPTHALDMPPHVFTISIGRPDKRTRAGYSLPNVQAMQNLVVALAAAKA